MILISGSSGGWGQLGYFDTYEGIKYENVLLVDRDNQYIKTQTHVVLNKKS
jgi:hypothetical protein